MTEQIYTEFDLSAFSVNVLHKRNSHLTWGRDAEQSTSTGAILPAMPWLPCSIQAIPSCRNKWDCSHFGQMECKSPKNCPAF